MKEVGEEKIVKLKLTIFLVRANGVRNNDKIFIFIYDIFNGIKYVNYF